MTTFRVDPNDPAKLVSPYAGATGSTGYPLGRSANSGTVVWNTDDPPRVTTMEVSGKDGRPVPYWRISGASDLIGGWESYVDNSSTHGVFVPYPGSTRKFNSSPQTTQTMARLAIPVSGNVQEFLDRSGLVGKLGDLGRAIVIQGNSGLGYIDFLLQNVQESFSEKVQVSDTIGDNYAAFFFGMSPPTFSFSGQLLNTYQDDWRMALHLLYQHLLRGTKLARYNKLISLYYDNIIVNGYMLNHNQNFSAEMQMASNFSFNLLVRSLTFLRLPESMPSVSDRLPSDLGFKTIAGLQQSAVKRTTRTIGIVAPESTPSKSTEESSGGIPLTVSLAPDPRAKQMSQNIYNPSAEVAEIIDKAYGQSMNP